MKVWSSLILSGWVWGIPAFAWANPPLISTVATDLLDISPQMCLTKAEKTIELSPMTMTTKGEDFVAGTWKDYKAMILCRSTSVNKIVVVYTVAGEGNEQVESIASRLADIFRHQ